MKHSMLVFWGAGQSLPHCVQPQAVRRDAPREGWVLHSSPLLFLTGFWLQCFGVIKAEL